MVIKLFLFHLLAVDNMGGSIMKKYDLGTRILHVFLDEERFYLEDIKREDIIAFVGGRGLGARLMLSLPKGLDPFSPDNMLIISGGTLNGTNAPMSGRFIIQSKSPATGLYAKSTAGSHFGVALKRTGIMMVVIRGKAENPTLLHIKPNKVSFMSGEKIWGKEIPDTVNLVKQIVNNPEAAVLSIGPAGENMVKFAGIMSGTYSFAARCGLGAVMGSKNLKAIAVSGNYPLSVAHSEKFQEAVKVARKGLLNDPGSYKYYIRGTSGSVLPLNKMKMMPSRNFQKNSVEDGYEISGENLNEKGYLKSRRGCFSCLFSCHRFTEITNKQGETTSWTVKTGGPELEALISFGAGCEIKNLEAILKANELCNRLGLDIISTGSVIQWAMESYERGVLSQDDVDGYNLKFGEANLVLELIKSIAYRRGFGNFLAEGVKKAAEIVGKDSYKWAIEAKGLEQSGVDTRCANAYALAFAVNPRGPDHLYAQPVAELGLSPRGRELITKITGDERWANPKLRDFRAKIVCWHEDVYAVTDSLGFCSFATTSTYGVTPELMVDFLNSAFDFALSKDDLIKSGKRIINMERCFNIREGATRKDDHLPWRLMNESAENDDSEAINKKEDLDYMLDDYYKLRGWNKESGIPKRETLKELGLEFIKLETE